MGRRELLYLKGEKISYLDVFSLHSIDYYSTSILRIIAVAKSGRGVPHLKIKLLKVTPVTLHGAHEIMNVLIIQFGCIMDLKGF